MRTEINLWYTDTSKRPMTITDNPRKAAGRFVKILKALGYPSLQPLIADINKIGASCTTKSKEDDINERERKKSSVV